MDRRPILFGLGIVTAGIIAGCFLQYRNETTNKECTRQLFAMDTVMSFTAYGKNSEQAVDAAVKEVRRLDELLSTVIQTAKYLRSIPGETEHCQKTRRRF